MPARTRPLRLADVGEFGFLDGLLPRLATADPDVLVGVGDDAAVLRRPARPVVVTTDALVEGIHFLSSWLTPRQLGRRAFLVNASDLAAMGAQPRWCLASVGAPAETAQRALMDLMLGMRAAARQHDSIVIGGNLTCSDRLFVSVTLIGTLPGHAVCRSGAKAGDGVFVSGTLGGAARAVRRLRSGERLPPRSSGIRSYVEPPARVGLGIALARARLATAMVDVSDGLLQDLGHLCERSRVGARIERAQVPLAPAARDGTPPDAALDLALTGGEDYELLFTVAPRNIARVHELGRTLGCRLTQIGSITAGARIDDSSGQPLHGSSEAGGHDHYRPSRHRRRRSP